MRQRAIEYVREKAKQCPDLAEEIYGALDWFLGEISDECNSVAHEYELLIDDIENMIKESKEE